MEARPVASPLDGIKILDLTQFQNGPWGTVMLSDMGAEVIKIEDPVNGDPARTLWLATEGPRPVSTYFETMNRNKKAMTLNLKAKEGQEVFYTMAKTADVITQNFRVGVADRLGVGYEAIKKINPKIVYGSVSGYGSKGPSAKEGVFDPLGQARGGLMNLLSVGDPEVTYKSAGGIADQMGAVTLAFGVLLGLIARDRHGVGQHVEVSQLGGILILTGLAINTYLLGERLPMARPRRAATNPLFSTYKCSDDRWIALGGLQSDRYWPALCEVMGMEHLKDDPKFCDMKARIQSHEELVDTMDGIFATKPRDEWVESLRAVDFLCSPVQNYDELPNDPQIVANEYFAELQHPTAGTLHEVGVTIKLSETPGFPRHPAPEFGQNTEEVLQEYGYTWDQIVELRDKGAI